MPFLHVHTHRYIHSSSASDLWHNSATRRPIFSIIGVRCYIFGLIQLFNLRSFVSFSCACFVLFKSINIFFQMCRVRQSVRRHHMYAASSRRHPGITVVWRHQAVRWGTPSPACGHPRHVSPSTKRWRQPTQSFLTVTSTVRNVTPFLTSASTGPLFMYGELR